MPGTFRMFDRDCLFSMRCDCGAQFQHAMQKVSEEGKGVILYLRQEGRGIGLIKIRAYGYRIVEPIRLKPMKGWASMQT